MLFRSIPGLNDPEMEAILEAAREAGAQSAGFVLLRLPFEIKDLFTEWLIEHVHDRAKHVLTLMRETRDGKLYNSAFFSRQRGTGPYAELIQQRCGVSFHPHYLRAWLTQRGYSPQRPTRRPRQRDDATITHWVANDWPRMRDAVRGASLLLVEGRLERTGDVANLVAQRIAPLTAGRLGTRERIG